MVVSHAAPDLLSYGIMGGMKEKDDRLLVQVMLPRPLVKEVDHLAVEEDVYRVTIVERLLREALAVRKVQG